MDGEGRRAPELPDGIAFLGFGLIGGSIALALRAAGVTARMAAWSPEGRGPAEGRARGIVDVAAPTPEAALAEAELVILAGPPLAILEAIDGLAGPWRPALSLGPTVTDVGSTKARILAAADAAGLPFVGGHPMAGRESSGVEAAVPDLFRERPWVVTAGTHAAPADVERVEALARAVGARPVRVAADEHDSAVAAISHLPLVLAAALVEAVADPAGPGAGTWPLARDLAASGWRDMTRLARGDAEMGAGILATNAAAVADRLRAARGVIDAWLAELEGTEPVDAEALRGRLAAARAALEPGTE